MKKLFVILSLAVLGCSSPVNVILGTPTLIPTLAQTLEPTQTPPATAEPGTEKNPLILALSPSAHPSEESIAEGERLAAFIESRTGYRVVTVAPLSESALVDAFAKGNAHIAALSPFGYLSARENNSVTAILASVRDGQMFYGAQFIINRESEFTSYFDSVRNENTANLETALSQFADKKPCWSDPTSPSGYVMPLGLLNQAGVPIRSGAFLEGQASVVRAVYAADICDFGVTYIDARDLPALEADYPDVMDRVVVVWRSELVIPYENISLVASLPIEMRRVLQRAFIDFMLTPQGKAAMQTIYGIDELQVVDDSMYDEFNKYTEASKIELPALLEELRP
jgi:phosphonate transport system substrate-binding protein